MLNLLLAQFRPRKGDYVANIDRIAAIFGQLDSLDIQPDVLVFPETAFTGYFLEGGVRELAQPAQCVFDDLQAAYLQSRGSNAPSLDVVVGFYERYHDRYFNSALYATLGSGDGGGTRQQNDQTIPCIRHVHRKVFLPTYGVFDEARFVESGHHISAFDTRWGRAALLICEDAWHSLTGTIAALDGAQIVFILSASPARGISGSVPGNVEYWSMLARNMASEHGIYVAISQLTGFEGGKGFAGGSLIVNSRGEQLVKGPLWQEALVQSSVDLRDLHLVRADLPLLADKETMLPHLLRELATAGQSQRNRASWEFGPGYAMNGQARHKPDDQLQMRDSADTNGVSTDSEEVQQRDMLHSVAATSQSPVLPVVAAPPFDPQSDACLKLDSAAACEWLVQFLREEVTLHRGFTKVVLGLSGGVDSALTAALCARAFGPKNVIGVRMPYRTSSQESLEHAQLVADMLGIQSLTIPISDAVDSYLRHAEDADARRSGNVMARMRMIVLFDQSARYNCIPIGTGNKTERLFGYFTWHADDSPPVNPLGDLFKTQVWQLAEYLGIPDIVVSKPASADLVVGQTDEADFGISYREADRILYWLLQGYTAERLVELGFKEAQVRIVTQRVNSTHWKRHLPSVAMLSSTAIGEYYLRPVDY
jgi:NAD+ synthase (glutamine-hydrolysing)